MRVVLVAREVSGVFLDLQAALCKDKKVAEYLDERSSIAKIQNSVHDASVTCIGISFPESQKEIAAAEMAMYNKIPFGFYAHEHNALNRIWLKRYQKSARFLFVINAMEAERARSEFPNAEIIVSGNPEWEEFCFPKFTRDEVRQKFGVAEEEMFVLSPGTKSIVETCILWGGIVEALHSSVLKYPREWKVFLSPHREDTVHDKISSKLWLYNDLVMFSRQPVKVEIIFEDIISASDMIPGCDLLIESASDMGIRAAHLRKPVIDFFSEIALTRMDFELGSRRWELCELGAAERVDGNSDMLAKVIQHILTRGTFAAQQEKVYPVPSQRGDAIRTMMGVLDRVVRTSARR